MEYKGAGYLQTALSLAIVLAMFAGIGFAMRPGFATTVVVRDRAATRLPALSREMLAKTRAGHRETQREERTSS
ncbi:MAG TPA: hypothetical protein VKB41_04710 [Steroidobacteraceae bacterium]|nr:hypothetical protein [Steroidobacteraceae bacterium]